MLTVVRIAVVVIVGVTESVEGGSVDILISVVVPAAVVDVTCGELAYSSALHRRDTNP